MMCGGHPNQDSKHNFIPLTVDRGQRTDINVLISKMGSTQVLIIHCNFLRELNVMMHEKYCLGCSMVLGSVSWC